jgi:hypothetical protein
MANPYEYQRRQSTLERAVNAGIVPPGLRMNHRSFANLYQLVSEVIYGRVMRPSRKGVDLYPPSVQAHGAFLRGICPSLPEFQHRLLVELPWSTSPKLGTSIFNHAHVKWVMTQVVKYLRDPALKSVNTNDPARVLILPFYKAQVLAYKRFLDQLFQDKKLSPEDMARVEVRTLDSSQGDARDLVIVDFVRTWGPGFCADTRRICFALSRAIQAEIVLMNRGMHAESYKWTSKDPDVDYFILRQIYQRLYDAKAHMIVPRDMTAVSAGPSDTSKRCRNCGQVGHRISECLEPLACQNCRSDKHVTEDCRKRPH